jgi:hypothetical protein
VLSNNEPLTSTTRFLSKALASLFLSAVLITSASVDASGEEHERTLNTEVKTAHNVGTEPTTQPVIEPAIPSSTKIITDRKEIALSHAEKFNVDSTVKFDQQHCESELLKQVDGVGFQYDAEIRSVSVQSERKITSTESGLWQMHSKAHWLFLSIEEVSVFMMPSWRLQNFEHKRKGMGSGKDLSITVDHNNLSYVSETAKEERTLNFEDELYDSLNYQLRLQLDVACNPNRNVFDYPIAKKKGVRQYHFVRLNDERIKTNIGEFDTVKLIKEEEEGKRKTTVWLAKELAYSVIKLDHTQDDKTDSLTISAKPKLNDLSHAISER